jgi:hypothetical protein
MANGQSGLITDMVPCAEDSATTTKRIKEKAINFCMEIKAPPRPIKVKRLMQV